MSSLIFPALNLAVLIGILVYYLRTPIRNAVLSRQKNIRDLVESAESKKIEAERKFEEFEKKLQSLETEATEILSNAQAEGNVVKKQIIERANKTAEQIILDAESTAQANMQDFQDTVRKDVIAQAIGLAEKIIRDGLSKEDQKRMINDYVGKVR